MQFDLSRAPRLSPLPEIAKFSKRSNHWLRVAIYAVVAIVIVWLLLWSRAQSKKIITQSKQAQAAYTIEVKNQLTAALNKSTLGAVELTTRGMALVAKDPQIASLILEVANTKDPKYRDAAVGAGFAELTVAESLWTQDARAAHDHAVTARRYLEAAQTIDPIHAKTYELLAIAYGNLGQTDLAAEATKKVTAFK
jgi:hypothetical protein